MRRIAHASPRFATTPAGVVASAAVGMAAALGLACFASTAAAQSPALDTRTTSDVLGGTFDASLTGRYEGLDDYARITGGAGLSLRSRLRWKGPETFGVRAVLGVDDLDARVHRPAASNAGSLVALPLRDRGASTLAALTWNDSQNSVSIGRQRLSLLGENAIAAPGWRPGEQNYDGLALRTKSLPRVDLRYAYVTGVNAPANVGRAATRLRGEAHLLDGTVDAGPIGAFSGFAYQLDFAQTGEAQNATYGVDWKREIPAGPLGRLPVGISYSAASARTVDAMTTVGIARYFQLETGVGLPDTKLKVGRGTSNVGPRSLDLLAPLYWRQGGIGRVGGAPAPGGVDQYALLQTQVGGTTIEIGRHEFRAPDARENRDGWTTSVSRKLTPRLQVQARVAEAAGPGTTVDPRTFWLQVGTSIP